MHGKICDVYSNLNKDYVYSYIDSYGSLPHSLNEEITLNGWAFAETERENPEKKIGIVFLDKDRYSIYLCDTLEKRSDVVKAFSENSIQSDHHGFSAAFSTVALKMGTYPIAVYDWENEENYGIAYTDLVLKKEPDGTYILPYESDETELPKEEIISKPISSCIDHITKDDALDIAGWAFDPETKAATQDVYLKLTYEDGKEQTFEAIKDYRQGVVDAFQKEECGMSGFHFHIPKAKLASDKDYSMQLFLASKGALVPIDIPQ